MGVDIAENEPLRFWNFVNLERDKIQPKFQIPEI
jgi:hypothetical protein